MIPKRKYTQIHIYTVGVSGFAYIAVREWTAIIVLPPVKWQQVTLIRVTSNHSKPD